MATLTTINSLISDAATFAETAKALSEQANAFTAALVAAGDAAVEAEGVAAEAAAKDPSATGAALSRALAELKAERDERADLERQLAEWKAYAIEVESERDLAEASQKNAVGDWGDAEDVEDAEEPVLPAAASSSTARPGSLRPRSPTGAPPRTRGLGAGPPSAAGARKRPRGGRGRSAGLGGPVWTTRMMVKGAERPAGYKLHLGDLPAAWQDGNELRPWLAGLGVLPADIASMDLTRFERWQVILTFDVEDDCRHAESALKGLTVETGKHATTTKWWRP